MTVSDDFHRPDGGLGGNYTQVTAQALTIASDLCVTAQHGGWAASLWSANTWSADQSSAITINSTFGSGFWAACARLTPGGGTATGYLVYGDASQIVLAATSDLTGNMLTTLATYLTGGVTGDVLLLDVTGSTLAVKKNGSTLGSSSDGTYSTGSAGLAIFPQTFAATAEAISFWEGIGALSATGGFPALSVGM